MIFSETEYQRELNERDQFFLSHLIQAQTQFMVAAAALVPQDRIKGTVQWSLDVSELADELTLTLVRSSPEFDAWWNETEARENKIGEEISRAP
jgi:hypothetical protein